MYKCGSWTNSRVKRVYAVYLCENSEIECNICYDTVTNAFALGCGHYFCRDCWKSQIKSYIDSYGVQLMV